MSENTEAIKIVGYRTRGDGEFVSVENWDGSRTWLPLADIIEKIREGF